MRRKHHLDSPLWPSFAINRNKVDRNIPSTRVKNWTQLVNVLNRGEFFNVTEQFLFRGQRHSHWGLTPSIARLSDKEIYKDKIAEDHLNNFKYSIRGRTKIPVAQMDSDDNIWALGQHYGLWTPLLDWSRSPFVAMFFAFNEPNPNIESPKNYSRTLFCINKSKLERYDKLEIFINPLGSDHDRLINQDSQFTLSPSGETSLEHVILNLLGENEIDIDDPEVLKDFISKIHIPLDSELERLSCINALKRMNIHHASLFPDLTGAAKHCNALVNENKREQAPGEPGETKKPTATTPLSVREVTTTPKNVNSILELLKSTLVNKEVEPNRLTLIAKELSDSLVKLRFVDWQERESLQAGIKSTTRALLRKLGYPVNAHETIVQNIVSVIAKKEKAEDE